MLDTYREALFRCNCQLNGSSLNHIIIEKCDFISFVCIYLSIMNCTKRFVKYLALYWRSIILVLIPILLLPIFLINDTGVSFQFYISAK